MQHITINFSILHIKPSKIKIKSQNMKTISLEKNQGFIQHITLEQLIIDNLFNLLMHIKGLSQLELVKNQSISILTLT